MIGLISNRNAWRFPAVAALAGVAFALTGCGGGGGGGGGSTTPTSITVVGVIKDSSSSALLPGHVVKIQGTSLQATANASSIFSIANSPSTGTITLAVYETDGTTLDGTKAVNLDAISLSSPGGVPTKNVGTIAVPVSQLPPPPPGL